MKKSVTITNGCSTMLLCFVLLGCSQTNTEVQKQQVQVQDEKQAFLLEKQEVGKSLKIPAELQPYEKAEISAKVEGFVQKVHADIGDRVKQGQVLAVLDAPESAARYAESMSRLQEANARYQASLDRYSRLQEAAREQGVVAQGELISARNNMRADSAAHASFRSTSQAYRQLQSYLTIRAPFSGIITARNIDAGHLVGGGAGQKSLFVLEKADRLRLRVHVPEAHVKSIPAEEYLSFTTDAIADKTFQAKLFRKSGSIDPVTRTEVWEYEYENKSGELTPGMYTVAQLTLNRPAASFVVPYTAIVTTLEKKFVVRVRDGIAEWVDIRQGVSLNNGSEVYGDLNEGDTLLVRGSEEIKPGTNIKTTITKESGIANN